MHLLLAVVVIFGCANCSTNQPTPVTIATNNFVLGSATMSNGTLVVQSTIPSNQLPAVASVGTNQVPTQLIFDGK